jgi:Xaa-Pro dipeptidase
VDLADRRAAVRRRMEQEGIDVLIAASSGFRAFDVPDPVMFLTGFQSLGESALVLGPGERSIWLVGPSWEGRPSDGLDFRAVDDVASEIAKSISSKFIGPLGAQRLATAGRGNVAPRLAASIDALAGRQAAAFDDTLYAACGRKTDAEIANARKATWLAERGFERMVEVARPGMRECDLAVEVNLTTKELGADDNFLMLSAAPHARGIMPSSTRPLQKGDIILAEFTPGVGGQFVQICRTAVIGPPSADLTEKYALVVDAMWSGIKAVRPGARVSDVCRGVDRVLEEQGFAEYCRPPHIRRRGHGFGLGSTWPGDIARDNDIVLAENEIFVVHPNQYLPGPGYMLCGEPVRVTADGVEVLTQTAAALAVIDC